MTASVGTATIVAIVLAGCGSRGPLDDTPMVGAAEDAGPDGATPPDAAGGEGKGRIGDGGAAACGSCLVGTCSQAFLACLQSTSCRTIFQCVATDCLSGGSGFDATCLFRCGGSDPQGALDMLAVFQCVTVQCGPECTTLLGGLGGLGGGGGRRDAGAGRRDGG